MKLTQLLAGISDSGFQDCEINGITNDSRKVEAGFLYVAIAGTVADGHNYAEAALQNGAAAVLVERNLGLSGQVIVSDSRTAYALACANYFGNPAKQLHLIGVTGTNGKTSITTMVKHVLDQQGLRAGLIGTIQIEYGDVVRENNNTTPDAYVLHQTLAEMLRAGCSYVVMEASSHALAQERLYGCHFDVCAFSNLTQDHLDYHGDMEDYFSAKCKLFPMSERHVINVRDSYGKRLAKRYPDSLTFSIEEDTAALYADQIHCTPADVSFRLRMEGVETRLHFAIPGLYSVENALTAIGICRTLGISMHDVITSLQNMKGISGRCEVIHRDPVMTVIRDYAHTPDGIENVLSSVKEYVTGRLIALFGCGGDRDRTKRPKMAAAAAQYADFLVVTSDNPRSEDPNAIIAEILPGIPASVPHVVVADRREAIAYVMTHAECGDTIMLLGKGHEDYQVLKTGTIHFNEQEVVREIADTLRQEDVSCSK